MKILRFNEKIYKRKAIDEAISAYSHLARFKARDNKGYIKVEIENIDPKVKDIMADEFSNYVLGIIKRCL